MDDSTITWIKIVGFIIAYLIYQVFRYISDKEEIVDITPDLPISFGYKTAWIAVKTDNKYKVAELLGLKKLRKANWDSALRLIRGKVDTCFVSPPIDGWVLVIQVIDSEEKTKKRLSILSSAFGEAQYFCTHRVPEAHTWILAKDGTIVRAYEYVGERGENTFVEGEPTEFEKQYNLINTFSEEAKDDDYLDNPTLFVPNENFVMQIAENWSINPYTLGEREGLEADLGLIGKL